MSASRELFMLVAKLTQMRLKAGLSQSEVAARIGVSSQAFGQWEDRKTFPTLPNLFLWIKALNARLSVDAIQAEPAPDAAAVAASIMGALA